MSPHSNSRKISGTVFKRVGVAVAAAATILLTTSVIPANAATTKFSETGLTAKVSGNTVTASVTIKSSQRLVATYAGVCARSKEGWDVDFPRNKNVTLKSSGTTVSTTKKFDAGTYKYFTCVYSNGYWTNVGAAKTFTVQPASSPVTTSTTPPTAASTTGSTSIPTGNVVSDGKTWTPVQSEDFNKDASLGSFGKVYGEDWRGYSGFVDTSNVGTYAPDKVLSVKNSTLDYYLHSENGKPLVAAPVPTGYTGQTYGRYSIRFKSDNIPGYKIAFLLWPSSDQWNDGEIDWPEGDLAGKMSPASAVIGSYGTVPGGMKFDPPSRVYSATDATDWHTATTEWTKGSVKWYWDGKLVGQTTNPAGVPVKPMRWTLQAETNLNGQPVPASSAGHIKVDWVVVYK